MKKGKKILPLALAFVTILSLAVPSLAAENDGEIRILYTNDTHTHIDNVITADDGTESVGLRFSTIAGYKKTSGADLLVDAGDHIEGTVYGMVDGGRETIIELMNATGYDVATLGNHEIDWNMEQTLRYISWADFDYVSANILANGRLLLKPYKVFNVDGKKVAFVGITTPTETLRGGTDPNTVDVLYDFSGGDGGAKMYASIQEAIDAAAKEADYVIALGHLGVDEASAPYGSKDVIANTTGLTAFIDSHSHTKVEHELVADKTGKNVVLTQTGCYLEALGEMIIAADGTVTTKLLSAEDLANVTPDAVVAAIENKFIADVETQMGEPIAYTNVTLNINGSDGKRSVRKEETNMGNLCADAYVCMGEWMDYDIDIAMIQGGGIRATIPAGPISLRDIKTVYPWDNQVGIKEVTGQELLDALEWSVRSVNVENTNEVGSFLSVANIKFDVNLAIPSTVQQDDNNKWSGAPTGERRVSNVQVKNRETGVYEPLNLNKSYTAISTKYLLHEQGDGYTMFKNDLSVDSGYGEYISLVQYVKSFPINAETGLPTIDAGMGYDEFVHTGRINYFVRPDDLDSSAWWYPAAIACLDAKIIQGTDKGFEADALITEATIYQTLYNLEGNPELDALSIPVATPDGAWYADALSWAGSKGVFEGESFTSDTVINRASTMAILKSYCALKSVTFDGLMVGNQNGDMMLDKALTRAELAQILVNLDKKVDR